jgi:hypothetical protein
MNASDKLDSDSHEITFALAEQDAWALLRAIGNAFPGTPCHPAPRWMRIVHALLKWCMSTLPISLLCLIVLLISFTGTAIKVWQVFLVAVVGVLAGILSAMVLPQRKLHPFVRAFMGLGRKRTIVLSRDGIHGSYAGTSSFTPWSVYTEVGLSDGFVLIYRNRTADFIPVSAFSSEEKTYEVARFIAARIKEGRCNDQPGILDS